MFFSAHKQTEFISIYLNLNVIVYMLRCKWNKCKYNKIKFAFACAAHKSALHVWPYKKKIQDQSNNSMSSVCILVYKLTKSMRNNERMKFLWNISTLNLHNNLRIPTYIQTIFTLDTCFNISSKHIKIVICYPREFF